MSLYEFLKPDYLETLKKQVKTPQAKVEAGDGKWDKRYGRHKVSAITRAKLGLGRIKNPLEKQRRRLEILKMELREAGVEI